MMGASAGGTVFAIEDMCFDAEDSKPHEAMSNYLFPLYEKLIEWKAIPSRNEAIATMPVMFRVREDDSIKGEEGMGEMSDDVTALLKTAYGSWTHESELIPDSPGRALVPLLPAGSTDEMLSDAVRERLIPASMISEEAALGERLNSTSIHRLTEGRNAYCVKAGRGVYVVNGSENWDRDAEADVALDRPYTSIRLELPVHSYALIVQDGSQLRIHCNGWRKMARIRKSHASKVWVTNPTKRKAKNSFITVSAEGDMTVNTETTASVRVLSSGNSARVEIDHSRGYANVTVKVDHWASHQ
jgi:hypothetical protein